MQATLFYSSPNGTEFLFTAVPAGMAGNGIEIDIVWPVSPYTGSIVVTPTSSTGCGGPPIATQRVTINLPGHFVVGWTENQMIAAIAAVPAAAALIAVSVLSGPGTTPVYSYGGGVQALCGGSSPPPPPPGPPGNFAC